MAGTPSKLAITSTKNRPPLATDSIQERCRRRMEETRGFAYDILFEILKWLPAKSLMRFTSVSRIWNSLIRHDPDFAKLHNALSRARPSDTRLLFELAIRSPYRNVVRRTSNSSTQLERFPLQPVYAHNYLDSREREVVICSNHCNGLVCLYSYEDSQVYLYNVTTRERKALPFTLRSPKGWCPVLYLGFDMNTERYKLLYRKKKQHYYKTKILTLGTNSWRRINEKCHDNDHSEDCIYLNGVLYWNDDSPETITYFNFIEEKFGTLLLPDRTYAYKLNKMQTVLWGKLVIYWYHCDYNEALDVVYDEVKKGFMKFNPDLEEKKVVLLEAESIDETIEPGPQVILATSSLISTSTSLVFPNGSHLSYISSFVENIIPLTFVENNIPYLTWPGEWSQVQK